MVKFALVAVCTVCAVIVVTPVVITALDGVVKVSKLLAGG